ncbi:MAG: agglutinin biogenesis protein MshI [Oxalobacter sp.]|nr:MAG: agglutinin biogenesis protein MshI [Oxalobacter sp.]
MGSFFKRKGKQKTGWMAINFRADGVSAAYVTRGGKGSQPVVEWLSFYPAEKAAREAMLERLGKDRGSSNYQCAFLLSPEDYQILSMDAPAVPPDELKSAVRWRLRDMIDFHIDDATFDVLAIPGEKGAGVRQGSMFAVVAKNQFIGQTQGMFDAAGVDVRVIDIPEMAQRNIAALVEPEGRAVAMLSVLDEGTLLTVTAGGELYLTRRMEVTSRQISGANAESAYERITLEMQRSLDHFDRQRHAVPLSKVVLVAGDGGDSLQDYLSKNLYVPVEQLDLASGLDFSKVPELKSRAMQQQNLMVIGAALRHEETTL